MNDIDSDVLQAMVEYYRNKCNKLEYDFLVYKGTSQKLINELTARISEAVDGKGLGNDTRATDDTA